MLARVKKAKKDYFNFKLAEITLESIRAAKRPEEASTKFEELYHKTIQNDPLFRNAEAMAVAKETVRMYNLAGMVGALHETLKTIPNKLISIVDRMFSRAYAMMSIVGAIASA